MASSMSASDMAALISKLTSLTNDIPKDEESRKKLFEATRSLNLALETAGETTQRICYLPLQLTVARVANDLNLFETLVEANGIPLSMTELAKKTSANPVLLKRILRFLASNGMIEEAGENDFTASNITHSLATPGLRAGINHNFDTMLPCYQSLPKFLRDTKYENPSDWSHSAFQYGHKTDLPAFLWLPQNPSNLDSFMMWMIGNRAGQKTWLDVFPFEQELFSNLSSPSTPVFVDLGGGIGHQCAALVSKFPQLRGRVILQDIAPVLQNALPTEGVEVMPHDFWTPQPVKGARAYYLRNILHDYADDKCVTLLKNTAAAMDKNSVILIDEMILPNKGINWQQGQLDIAMMAALAARERSRGDWESLLDAAGLKIAKVFTYVQELSDSIMVLVPK